jgi:hypothetical protein
VAGGLETYSAVYFIEWSDASGKAHSVRLTPELNENFQGPYNRRNIYGAALAFGPVLAANPKAKPMLMQVLRKALCGDAPILRELGIDTSGLVQPVRIRYEPKVNQMNLPLVLEAPCVP